MIDREPLQGAPTGAHEPGVASLDAAPLFQCQLSMPKACFLRPRGPSSAFSNRHKGNVGFMWSARPEAPLKSRYRLMRQVPLRRKADASEAPSDQYARLGG